MATKPKKKPRRKRPESRGAVPAEFRIIEAEGESDFRLVAADSSTESEGTNRLRRFTMTAYTGGKLNLPNFLFPVVADLSGMRISAKSRPILRDHDLSRIVGHTDTIDIGAGSIRLTGVISAANAYAREVADSADNGFPWQASIGATAAKVSFVDERESVEVNGRRLTGPLYVARQSLLREISFVALGADDQTSARLAAGQPGGTESTHTIGVTDMEFETWLEGMGFRADELNEPQTTSLRALYEKESSVESPVSSESSPTTLATGTDATTTTSLQASHTGHSTLDTQPLTNPTSQPPLSPVDELRAQWGAERRRIAKIAAICGGKHPEIEAQAIEEGWDDARTELAVMRAIRPKAPAVGSGASPLTMRTLEAAVWMSANVPEPDCLSEFGERTLEAAHPLRQIGLRELVAECARLEGHDIPRVFGDGKATIIAGFATISLPGILESVMNRTMLAAYEASPIAALQLCAVGSVSDFKEVSRYRLLGTGGFEKVSPTGELKSGTVAQQKFSNKADTYGQMLILDRRDIVNDDLDAFLDLPRQMGRSGAESIDDLFFTLFLSNPGSFFDAVNSNYLEGATTTFGPDSLTVAKTLFRKQKAGPGAKPKDQKPINVRPKYLVVPVELETEAELLMGAAQLMIDASGTKTKIPVDNPHRNKYEVVSMPHLSDAFYTGNSAKAWYLFADPAVLPAFEIVFLNGKKTPTIERVEAPPNTLGMGLRAFLDVGCREQDPRGAVKVKGE
ncbi:MAG: hypothetical protein ACK5Q5_04755 [Planctomycetaceae bacterium]